MKRLDEFIRSKILKLTEQEFQTQYYYKNAQRLFEIEILTAILNYTQTGEVSKQQLFAVKRYWDAKECIDYTKLYDTIRQEDYFNLRYRKFIDEFDLSSEEITVLKEIQNTKFNKRKKSM